MFLIMEKWPYGEDILWGPASHSFWSAVCSRGVPCVCCVCPSVVTGLTTVCMLVGGVGPQPSWLPGPASCGGYWPACG